LDDALDLSHHDTSHDPPMSELCIELAAGDPSEYVSGLLVSRRTLLVPLLLLCVAPTIKDKEVKEDQRGSKKVGDFGAALPAIFVP
jgi:hypothetical protein